MIARDSIMHFVQTQLTNIGDRAPLSEEESLFHSGRLQSIDAVELIVFLEETFGVDFSRQGFDIDRFDSVKTITEVVVGHSTLP